MGSKSIGRTLLAAVAAAASWASTAVCTASEGDAVVKTWVFFTDKAVEPGPSLEAALRAVRDDYDPRAVERRQRRRTAAGLFDERDLPVVPAYVEAVVATGARHHVTSRWLNAISAWMTAEQTESVAALPFVRGVEPVRRRRGGGLRIASEEVAPPAVAGGGFHGQATEQLELINLVALHESGFAGEGMVIGVLDTGFRRTHAAFNHPSHPLQVVAEWDFVSGDDNTELEQGDHMLQHVHGTQILGALAAYLPGTLVGAAYDASYILCKTEDTSGEYPAEEDNFVAGLEFIEMNGGDVATSSVGDHGNYDQEDLDGNTSVMTIGLNVATENGLHCCTVAGNSGHDDDPTTSHLVAPSDALQVVTCGAVDLDRDVAFFSSDGPTADGRVKPEVLAAGWGVVTVSYENDDELMTASGTSMAAPCVAGAIACIAQASPGWTVDQMRSFLFSTGDYRRTFGEFDPLFVQGYGVIDALAVVSSDCNGNGLPDVDEVESGTAGDVNGNGAPDECDADLDGDGIVGVTDLSAVILAWGPNEGTPEDIDGDGAVNVNDLVIVLLNWG